MTNCILVLFFNIRTNGEDECIDTGFSPSKDDTTYYG